MKKKILIVGGSSLLALTLIYFFKKKYKIFLLCNKKKPLIPDIKSYFIKFEKKIIFKTLKKIEPDVVIICSANTNIENCEKFKKKTSKINYELPKIFTDFSNQINYKIIFFSTDQVYKDIRKLSHEKSPILGVNFYTKSKLLAEKYISKNSNKSLILRTNFFGYGPKYRSSFSDNILKFAAKNKKKEYFDDSIFSAIYMPYLAKCLIKLIEKNIYGIFNIVSSNSITKYKFAIEMMKTFQLNEKLVIKGFLKNRLELVKRPLNMSLSNKKIKKKLDIDIPNIEKQIQKMKKDFASDYYYFIKNIKLKYKNG